MTTKEQYHKAYSALRKLNRDYAELNRVRRVMVLMATSPNRAFLEATRGIRVENLELARWSLSLR